VTRARAIAAGAALLLVSAAAGLLGSAALSGGGDGGRPAANVPGNGSALPGAAGGSTRFSAEAALSIPKGASVVARADRRSIRVYERAGGGRARTLRQRTFESHRLPLVFLVDRRRDGWVRAFLPARPNLSRGWLRASDVKLATTPFRVRVALRHHRLTLFRDGRRVMSTKIAKGRSVSPTPTGRYYVTDVIRPPDPHGFYGPYALGLSAHSPVYTSFAGGDGQIGLHGTNQPSVLGTDVSHGCIRVANRVITKLARRLPLGTPVDITRS
jgi:lipoprotein-anchoring transpeptidase ErfK/SrfK